VEDVIVHRAIDQSWIVPVAALLAMAPVGQAASILPPERFDSGDTAGWTTGVDSARPVIRATGGPAGEGDRFLLLTASGANGPGSRLAVFNDDPAWTGDLKGPGITGLALDMWNPPESSPLQMRLVLLGPDTTGNRWTSAEAVAVANDGVWRSYFFPVDEGSFSRVLGNASYADLAGDAVRILLRHDSGGPSAGGTTVQAQLGIDNLAFVPEPSVANLLVWALLGPLALWRMHRYRLR
jgi:hypothetical protein